MSNALSRCIGVTAVCDTVMSGRSSIKSRKNVVLPCSESKSGNHAGSSGDCCLFELFFHLEDEGCMFLRNSCGSYSPIEAKFWIKLIMPTKYFADSKYR
jgi:hypothetical protein